MATNRKVPALGIFGSTLTACGHIPRPSDDILNLYVVTNLPVPGDSARPLGGTAVGGGAAVLERSPVRLGPPREAGHEGAERRAERDQAEQEDRGGADSGRCTTWPNASGFQGKRLKG